MADNTRQFNELMRIVGGLQSLFRDDPNIFVAGDLLWYPVEGRPDIRTAPDALVAFGRPMGYRGSYKQWEEGGVPPTVVFEILSPGNRMNEMIQKFNFYERYGVEEYYLYDPDRGKLEGWLRDGEELKPIPDMLGWTSPRLRVRFDLNGDELVLIGPDGRNFESFVEVKARASAAETRASAAESRAEAEAAERRRLEAELAALRSRLEK